MIRKIHMEKSQQKQLREKQKTNLEGMYKNNIS